MSYGRLETLTARLSREELREFNRQYEQVREQSLEDIRQTRLNDNRARREEYDEWLADPEGHERDIRYYRPTAGLDLSECGTEYDVDRKFALDTRINQLNGVGDEARPVIEKMTDCLSQLHQEVSELNIEAMIMMKLSELNKGNAIGRAANEELAYLTHQVDVRGTAFNGVNTFLDAAHGDQGYTVVSEEWLKERTPEEKQGKVGLGINGENWTRAALQEYGLSFEECAAVANAPRVLPSVKLVMDNNPEISLKTFGENLTEEGYEAISATEREYGSHTYDRAFGQMFSAEQKALAAVNGLSEFDLITINGVTATELIGDKYKDAPEALREQLMKCEITKAALDPKNSIDCMRVEENGLSKPVHVERECKLEEKFSLWQRIKKAVGIHVPTRQEQIAEQEAVMETPEEKRALEEKLEAVKNKVGIPLIHETAKRAVEEYKAVHNASINEANFYSELSGREMDPAAPFDVLRDPEKGLATFFRNSTRTSIAALYAITYSDMSPEEAFDARYVGAKPRLGKELFDTLANGSPEEVAKVYQDMGEKLMSLQVPEIDPSKPMDMIRNYPRYAIIQEMYIDFDQTQHGQFIRNNRAAVMGVDSSVIKGLDARLDHMGMSCAYAQQFVDTMADDAYVDRSKVTSTYIQKGISSRQQCEFLAEEYGGQDFQNLDIERFPSNLLTMRKIVIDTIGDEINAQISPEKLEQYLYTGKNEILYMRRDEPPTFDAVCTDPDQIRELIANDKLRREQEAQQKKAALEAPSVEKNSEAEPSANKSVEQLDAHREKTDIGKLMDEEAGPPKKRREMPEKKAKTLEKKAEMSGPGK